MVTGKPFVLEIVTPERIVFEGQVDSVTVPGTHTPFQMLVNHAPIVSSLAVGELRFTDAQGTNHIYATSGGFAQMVNNKASVVVETAEEAGSIDIVRAQESRRRAEERLAKRSECDTARAELALSRALNRLKVSSGKS
jgi:F-type H+-transporting ATPase subunit epsilon